MKEINFIAEYLDSILILQDERQAQLSAQWAQKLSEKLEDLPKLSAIIKEKDFSFWRNTYRQKELQKKEKNSSSNHYASMIDWRANQDGLKRLSHFISAIIKIHLQKIENPLFCGNFLKNANINKENRNFILLIKGNAFLISASDELGTAATPAQIENIIYEILKNIIPADLPFTAYSHLLAQSYQEIKGKFRKDEEAKVNLSAVENALFSLSLENFALNDMNDALSSAAFADSGSFFADKPLNYYCNIAENRYFIHSESAFSNPIQLNSYLEEAQQIFSQREYPYRNQFKQLIYKNLSWNIEAEIKENLHEYWHKYQRNSENLTCSSYELFFNFEIKKFLSEKEAETLILFLLQYAFQKATGSIANAYFHIFQNDNINTISLISSELENLIAAADSKNDLMTNLKNYQKILENRSQEINPELKLFALQEYAEQKNLAISELQKIPSLNMQTLKILRMPEGKILRNIAFVPQEDDYALSFMIKRNSISILLSYKRHKFKEVQAYLRELKFLSKELLTILTTEAL